MPEEKETPINATLSLTVQGSELLEVTLKYTGTKLKTVVALENGLIDTLKNLNNAK